MNVHISQFNFNNLEHLITRARKRRNLTELETGLLNVAANAVERAQYGADSETLRCLMAMAEKIQVILSHQAAKVIDFTGHFHRSVCQLEPKLDRRWNSRVGIERRVAA